MTKSTFEARPDVAWVNGQPVPESRRLQLNEAEARYDLALGRIVPGGSGKKAKHAEQAKDDPAKADE